jgi:hypothetical protein
MNDKSSIERLKDFLVSVEYIKEQPILRGLINTIKVDIPWYMFAHDTIVVDDTAIEDNTKLEP